MWRGSSGYTNESSITDRTAPVVARICARALAVPRGPDGRHRPGHGDRRRPVRLPPMLKQEAQDDWDAIVTTPDIDRAGAERVLAQQRWFSYTSAEYQVFSSGGSSGVRVCRYGIGSSS